MSKKRLLAVATCAAAVMGVGANAALAGEVTGSGKNENQNQGTSWCSFSGLNDQVDGPIGPRAQSYGQELKLGLVDPHVANPGFFCNPNKTPLPPNPNRHN
jgi:opacity protein-like surface antigen